MIGIDLYKQLNQILSESNSSLWIDTKTSFDYLYQAAIDFQREIKSLHTSQAITSVASQADYALNPDFLEVMIEDSRGNKVVDYDSSWLTQVPYRDIVYSYTTATATVPSQFAITDYTLATQKTGTATSAGTQVGGQSTLTDTTASFSTLAAGDEIINITQSYTGIVLSVTSGTAVVTAMFNTASAGSPYVGWTQNDVYRIQPCPRYKLVIDPLPAVAGDTITVTYLQKPPPVYSDYGSYRFATGYEDALVKYAAWLYKYRDSQPNQADYLYKTYDMLMRKAKTAHRNATGRVGFRISYLK